MGQPAGSKGRSKGVLLVLLIVAVVGAGVGYFVTQGDNEPETAPNDEPTTDVGAADDLKDVESGGASYDDPIFGAQYGWGVEIKNSGEQVATLVHVVVEFQDADGNVVETVEDYIASLAPGDEIGIGGSIARDDVHDFEVTTIEPSGWASPEGQGKLVTSNIEHGVGSLDRVKVSFDADSTYDTAIRRPRIRVVFRNAEGEIVGGASDFSTGFMEPEGQFRDSVEINQTFPDVDPDKTEVYLEPSE